MTALDQYQRLECPGIWRADARAQRRDVIVSFGEATLVISDPAGRALAHWSLPAVSRANQGRRPALYHPDGDPGETLEIADETMVSAIERVRKALRRGGTRPGRLRLWAMLAVAAAVAALAVLWLPGALVAHATTVVPEAKRAALGEALLGHVTRISGPPCRDPSGVAALRRMAGRLPGIDPAGLVVVGDGVRDSLHLPGGLIVLDREVIEESEDPAVPAGYALAEAVRAGQTDPLARMLQSLGTAATLRLLTTGEVSDTRLAAYAEDLVAAPADPVDPDRLLAAFAAAGLPAAPYAYALDPTGEATLGLIEADPFASSGPPRAVLSDADWVALQGICGG